MVNVYSDYSRARIGWFFGLSGAQLGAVAAGAVPVAWSIPRGAWAATTEFKINYLAAVTTGALDARADEADGHQSQQPKSEPGAATRWENDGDQAHEKYRQREPDQQVVPAFPTMHGRGLAHQRVREDRQSHPYKAQRGPSDRESWLWVRRVEHPPPRNDQNRDEGCQHQPRPRSE